MARDPSNKAAKPLPLLGPDQVELAVEAPRAMERGSNIPEVSVSELSSALKRTVEDRFGFVRLRGEISNYRGPHASGHAYFCIKDEGARIDAVAWKTTLARMRIKPEEGLEVVASGKITTFPGKSSYQIVVEALEPAGIGALMVLIEERRQRLAAEGLFDAARKKLLPYLPRVIGVVTSPTGAVIRDILHRVAARFRRHVIVWPVRVQGETSGAEIAAAILGFNGHSDASVFSRPDLIIVARGGGSLEDLWGFNDEAVVRAVAGSLIPLISAVGHETDWTLIDHAADLRAPTPTGAAELALPVLADLQEALDRLRRRHANAALRQTERAQNALRGLVRLLPTGGAELLGTPRQRLDRAVAQLPATLRGGTDQRRLLAARLGNRLRSQSPDARMARATQRLVAAKSQLARAAVVASDRRRAGLETLGARLRAACAARQRVAVAENKRQRGRLLNMSQRLHALRRTSADRGMQRLGGFVQLLQSLSYRNVLARGYALLQASDGTMLRSAAAAREAGRVSIELIDGRVEAQVTGRDQMGRTRKATTSARRGPDPQGKLFDS